MVVVRLDRCYLKFKKVQFGYSFHFIQGQGFKEKKKGLWMIKDQ